MLVKESALSFIGSLTDRQLIWDYIEAQRKPTDESAFALSPINVDEDSVLTLTYDTHNSIVSVAQTEVTPKHKGFRRVMCNLTKSEFLQQISEFPIDYELPPYPDTAIKSFMDSGTPLDDTDEAHRKIRIKVVHFLANELKRFFRYNRLWCHCTWYSLHRNAPNKYQLELVCNLFVVRYRQFRENNGFQGYVCIATGHHRL